MSMVSVAIAIFAMAVPMFVYSAQGWRKFRCPAQWPTVPATVAKSWLAEIEIDNGEGSIKGWEPRIVLDHKAPGGVPSPRLSLDEKGYQFTSHRLALRFLGAFPPGTAVVLHVSPQGAAVLFADVNWTRKSHYLAWAAFGTLLMALAAFFLFHAWVAAQ